MRILAITSLIFTIVACQQVGFQKRKHLKGYYFSHAPRLKKGDNDAAFDLNKTDSIRNSTSFNQAKTDVKQKHIVHANVSPANPETVVFSSEAKPLMEVKAKVSPKNKGSKLVSKFGVSSKKTYKYAIKARSKSTKRSSNEFIGWYGLIGLSLFGFAYARRNKKARLTAWANKNRKQTVAVIVAGLGANYLSTVYLGRNLAELGFTSNGLVRDVLIGLTGLSILSFPTNRRFVNNFKNRTRAFVILYTLISALGINSGIRIQNRENLSVTEQHMANYFSSENQGAIQAEPFTGTDLAWRIPLTILFIASNVALGILLFYLVCALVCSGFGVVAVLVGVLGYGGIIVGMIFTLRAIWKKPGSGRIKPTKSDDPNNDPDEGYFTNPVIK